MLSLLTTQIPAATDFAAGDTTSIKVDTISVDSMLEASQHQIELMKQIAEKTVLEHEFTPPAYTLETIIAISAVLIGLVCIYLYKTQHDKITSLNRKLKEYSDKAEKLESKLGNLETDLKNTENYIRESEVKIKDQTPRKTDTQRKKSDNVHKTTNTSVSLKASASTTALAASTVTKSVFRKKYADFYIEDGDALVENRDLSDNPSDGKFIIMVDENSTKAQYTVNTSQQQAIFEDILNFQRFATIKEIPATYTSIRIERDGEVVKSAGIWKIVRKVELKFV